VEAESGRPLADPPATWQEHWFDHRQLLRVYQSDEHCAISAVVPELFSLAVSAARGSPPFLRGEWVGSPVSAARAVATS
jgi:hypothetical protein